MGDAQIFYAKNATDISAETALATSWIGPSVTPLTNLNSGFRVYEVDSAVRGFLNPRLSHNLIDFIIRHSTSWTLTRKSQIRFFRETRRLIDRSTMCRWRSDVNSFPKLDGQTSFGPTYVYEYSTRATYGTGISGWGSNDPLNATWWHLVTDRETAFAPSTRASLLTQFLLQRWK